MTDTDFNSDFFWDPAFPISAEELTRKRMQRERQKMDNQSGNRVSARVLGKPSTEKDSSPS